MDPALAGLRNRAKLGMDLAPWDRCLFLDTDTYVVGDLGPGSWGETLRIIARLVGWKLRRRLGGR